MLYVIAYGCEIWTLTRGTIKELRMTVKAIECSNLGITKAIDRFKKKNQTKRQHINFRREKVEMDEMCGKIRGWQIV